MWGEACGVRRRGGGEDRCSNPCCPPAFTPWPPSFPTSAAFSPKNQRTAHLAEPLLCFSSPTYAAAAVSGRQSRALQGMEPLLHPPQLPVELDRITDAEPRSWQALYSYVDPAFSTNGIAACFLAGAGSSLLATIITYKIRDDAAGMRGH